MLFLLDELVTCYGTCRLRRFVETVIRTVNCGYLRLGLTLFSLGLVKGRFCRGRFRRSERCECRARDEGFAPILQLREGTRRDSGGVRR